MRRGRGHAEIMAGHAGRPHTSNLSASCRSLLLSCRFGRGCAGARAEEGAGPGQRGLGFVQTATKAWNTWGTAGTTSRVTATSS
jgi:hypothetical protein